jgi:hypothetical protein
VRFDASTIFVLGLTAAVIVTIALINVYRGDTTIAPSSSESGTDRTPGERQVSSETPKSARKR